MDFYPLKAQFKSDDEVGFCLELEEESWEKAFLKIYRLNQLEAETEIRLPKERKIVELSVGIMKKGEGGYGAELTLLQNGKQKVLETAFDIESERLLSLRYGFVSDFETKDREKRSMDCIRRYHINMVQFYDWSYRHDQLVSDVSSYRDMMGKAVDLDVVKEKIEEAAVYGIRSIAYGAVYAASKDFFLNHRDWAFYNEMQEPLCFINTFYIMNIMEKAPWRRHLIEQYRDAVEKVGFDGIHMDTYGFPKTAYSHLEEKPSLIELKKEFPGLIRDVRLEIKKLIPNPVLIFNNVGNWPVANTASSAVDVVYIEVWQPYERYFHIKQLIAEAKIYSDNQKPVILAAYLEPFRTDTEARATTAAQILTAAIISNGAGHLLIGEENAVLTQGYYGDYTTMSEDTIRVMRRYYDFMIRYMDLFYDKTLEDVSMTHIGWDNYEYKCDSSWSVYGEPEKIWLTIRENREYKVISVINLCGCADDYWNRGKELPIQQKDIDFTIYVDHEIRGVYWASPDSETGKSKELEYQYLINEKGRFVHFRVPVVEIWTLVYIHCE